MKKKVIVKALAIVVILVGVILLGQTVQGVIQGNTYYDLFRKIGVNIHDVYADIDSKGLDQVKDDYRGVFAVVDEMDALGGSHIKAALDGVNTAYGLVDTIEATESIVASVNAVGAEKATQGLNEIFDAISDANKARAAVKAAGADNAETYLEDVKAALEDQPDDLTAARAAVDAAYADLDDDTSKQVKKFFDYMFQLAGAKGNEQAVSYMEALLESPDQSDEEFARQVIEQKYADDETEDAAQSRQYSADVFRLITDQGSAQAKTYIQQILKTLQQKDIPDARAYLDEVYVDNKDNHVTRKYLNSIFQVLDSNGAEYAKVNGGEICALVNQEDVDLAKGVLTALDGASSAADASGERLSRLQAALQESGAADLKDNRYLADVLAISTEVDKAVSAADRALSKADKSAAAADKAKEAADAAQAAVSSAATEEEKAAAKEAADAAKAAYETALAKAQKDRDDADKKKVGEEAASQYVSRLEAAVAGAKESISPDSLEKVKQFQNHVCQLISQTGAEKVEKYTNNAYKKVYSTDSWDKTLRLSRLGTDNVETLDALDGGKVNAMRNKARMLMLTAACLIIGIALLFVRVSESSQPKLSREERSQMGTHMGLKTSRLIANSAIHAVLIIISVIWLIPFISIVLQSFRVESTHQVGYVMPDKLNLYNYADLFSTDFPRWYANTFIMALVVAVLQTIIVLCMSYTLSRFRFKMRKPLMRFMLILGMFPGMLTMIILYRVLADLGLTQEHAVPGLILVYIASSGMGYYVSKGFFDTLPKSLDEAARVDGATRFQVTKRSSCLCPSPS